ncbi:hypothetical protein SAMN05421856_11268 [Chryseobacterium taichungense]|uniref:Uncharacterized protein n=1 Tax=Chryseobacterium taichungense TaxID=295069 RepID=A0A1H8DBH9_9FLAO|nr:hypothetical protein [Chryseobacterium taichungense]SEN04164.1 hypothetical protein SAMN05421856_11268 [Chryseobacterium taichungense]
MKFEFSTFKTVASCSILMLTNLSLSGQEKLIIDDEVVSKVKINNNEVSVIIMKEIDDYNLVKGKVMTHRYSMFLNSKNDYKEFYDEYINSKKSHNIKYDKRIEIINLLNTYLNEKDDRLLDKAAKLANELNLKFEIDDKSSTYAGWGVKPKKILYIKKENKYASKSMLKEYMDILSLQTVKNEDGQMPDSAQRYLRMVEEEKSLTEEYKYEDAFVKSTDKLKRTAYFQDSEKTISNFSTIKGTYDVISKYMTIARETIEGKFLENEVSDKIFEEYGQDGEGSILIKNSENNSYYLLSHEIYDRIRTSNFANEGIAIAKKFGYTIYDDKGYKYIKTKYYDISCNGSLSKILQKDQDYLKKLDIWFEQREAIRKQTILMIPKLDHYVRLYRMQRNRMSKADISAWTTLTKSANLLNKKQVDLNDKLFGWTDRNDSDKNYYKYSDDFINYLSASKGVLGI